MKDMGPEVAEITEAAAEEIPQKRGWKERLIVGLRIRSLIEFFTLQSPPLNPNGIYDVGSESFRDACAIKEDGTVYVVPTYISAEISVELYRLRKEWRLPKETSRLPVSLTEMRKLRGYSSKAKVVHSETAGQMRMIRVLKEAAALGASDVKLVERDGYGDFRIKVGAGEFSHGPQWQVREVHEAVNWIFGHRDGGDGQASLVIGVPVGFSIGQAARLKQMPEGVAAFRGQIAWPGDVNYFLNLRLLYAPKAADYGNVAGLGLETDILESLARERRSESGLVIIGGSTGDGKSTTLVRNLEKLYLERKGQVSLYTIEDPIEYPSQGEGVVQFPVVAGKTPEERKANYSKMLMTFVRTNPDIGMVSEIRSANDVNEVLHFVSSGHKIYTTVHASSANAVLFRLISLGVLPSEISGPEVVNMVMRQKLVPTLCKSCARPLKGKSLDKVLAWLEEDKLFAGYSEGISPNPMRRNTRGCEVCLEPYEDLPAAAKETAKNAWAGYAGRRATAELIDVDEKYRKHVDDRDQLGAFKHWLAPKEEGGMGGIPVATRVRRLIAEGQTDYEHYTNDHLEDDDD